MPTPAAPAPSHGHSGAVDLRSDTVTRPTPAMYERMRQAPLGDDGLDGDPSAIALEEAVARHLGKEAGLFVPSCTMGNLLAVLVHAPRQAQVLLESTSHIYTAERGGATLSGTFYLGVAGVDGAMDMDLLADALSPGVHALKTGMVAMETSHNNAGGTVLPLVHMQAVHGMAAAQGIAVHLDGARLLNAAVAQAVPPATIACHADTVSLCLSKGLSAPVGAVLAGSRASIAKARQLRRMLGGAQRQTGIMAAAGLEAIETMVARLAEDHARARRLSDAVNRMAPALRASSPQTNIVQVEVGNTGHSADQWAQALRQADLWVRPWGPQRLRCVTHRHVQDADIDRAAQSFKAVLEQFQQAACPAYAGTGQRLP